MIKCCRLRVMLIHLLLFVPAFCPAKQECDQPGVSQKTVLLTGAAGFIGSNFLKYLFDRYPSYCFIVLDALTYAGKLNNIPSYIKQSGRFEFWHGSINDPELVNDLMSRAHFVVHFAAETHVTRSIYGNAARNNLYDNTEFSKTNCVGTHVMLNALVKNTNIERFIHISTSEVYGTAERDVIDEDHPLNPRSPYAGTKAGADRIVSSYWCTHDHLPIVIVRPFNNYGPRQDPEKLIPLFITNALQGKRLTIHGDGSAQRDWLHVQDHCRGLDRILHIEDFSKIKHTVINLGTGISLSVLDIAHMILEYLNLPATEYLTFVGDRPGQVARHTASYKRAEELLGWKPEISFKSGLAQVIDWYRDNQDWWKPQEFNEFLDTNNTLVIYS